MKKPKKLNKDSKLAAISLSWGGAGQFPWRYEAGKKQLEEEFGCEVIPTKHALESPEWIAQNPQARAQDLMEAFQDDSIDGIISMIGGDESIRILPYLDLDVIAANPKVFMGYSDTTITHAACFKAGIVSFYGPAIMAGFAENVSMFPYMVDSVRKNLFSNDAIGELQPNQDGWTVEHYDWGVPENQKIQRKLTPCSGWKFYQDSGVVEGELFGGCFEVLDFLRGTDYFPSADRLKGAVLFLEGSEEAPPPHALERFLRSLGAMGVLQNLKAILLGRPGGEMEVEKFVEYDDAILKVVRDELGLNNLAIVTHMDFGHTDPFMVMPLGVKISIDSETQSITIPESTVL